jgi:branched-chain amino acid transport system ATP-binding protein
MAATHSILSMQGVSKRFGGLQALTDISLTIERGDIYGVIGPNGAGKTTLFNVLTGLYQPDEGEFIFHGEPLQVHKPHEVAERGIARTFQNIRLFHNMTALENVMVGRHVRTRAGVIGAIVRGAKTRGEEASIASRASQLLDYVGLKHRRDFLAKNLPYGDQRRLEIARDGDRSHAARARRTRRRHERDGDRRAKKFAGKNPRRRHDDFADRTRREAGDGFV